ncbi:hypothetical protein ACJJIW_11635 [Microbulbifer sp. JMSA004]|uniref:hypothetical protein n=1 Tax=Microbulbifer sp. JMSA004 TaxID=3243370 RepID=UPI00403979A5
MNQIATQDVVRISDSLSKGMDKLYKTGGVALAFGFAGILSMVLANIPGLTLPSELFVVGAILTIGCFLFFVYTHFQGARKALAEINENKPLIDAVQDVSLQVTELTSVIQAYSFKNLSKIHNTLEVACPIIEGLPLVGDKAKEWGLNDASRISGIIVDTTENTKNLVTEVKEALIKGDLKKLKSYSKDLQQAVDTTKEALKTNA